MDRVTKMKMQQNYKKHSPLKVVHNMIARQSATVLKKSQDMFMQGDKMLRKAMSSKFAKKK